MEKTVNLKDKVEGFQKKPLFHSKSSTVFMIVPMTIFTEYIERWGHHERSYTWNAWHSFLSNKTLYA